MTFKRLASAIALAAMMLASTGKANGQTPRPEYPRPQFERSEWMNLNGTWTYSFDFGKTGEQKGWKNNFLLSCGQSYRDHLKPGS